MQQSPSAPTRPENYLHYHYEKQQQEYQHQQHDLMLHQQQQTKQKQQQQRYSSQYSSSGAPDPEDVRLHQSVNNNNHHHHYHNSNRYSNNNVSTSTTTPPQSHVSSSASQYMHSARSSSDSDRHHHNSSHHYHQHHQHQQQQQQQQHYQQQTPVHQKQGGVQMLSSMSTPATAAAAVHDEYGVPPQQQQQQQQQQRFWRVTVRQVVSPSPLAMQQHQHHHHQQQQQQQEETITVRTVDVIIPPHCDAEELSLSDESIGIGVDDHNAESSSSLSPSFSPSRCGTPSPVSSSFYRYQSVGGRHPVVSNIYNHLQQVLGNGLVTAAGSGTDQQHQQQHGTLCRLLYQDYIDFAGEEVLLTDRSSLNAAIQSARDLASSNFNNGRSTPPPRPISPVIHVQQSTLQPPTLQYGYGNGYNNSSQQTPPPPNEHRTTNHHQEVGQRRQPPSHPVMHLIAVFEQQQQQQLTQHADHSTFNNQQPIDFQQQQQQQPMPQLPSAPIQLQQQQQKQQRNLSPGPMYQQRAETFHQHHQQHFQTPQQQVVAAPVSLPTVSSSRSSKGVCVMPIPTPGSHHHYQQQQHQPNSGQPMPLPLGNQVEQHTAAQLASLQPAAALVPYEGNQIPSYNNTNNNSSVVKSTTTTASARLRLAKSLSALEHDHTHHLVGAVQQLRRGFTDIIAAGGGGDNHLQYPYPSGEDGESFASAQFQELHGIAARGAVHHHHDSASRSSATGSTTHTQRSPLSHSNNRRHLDSTLPFDKIRPLGSSSTSVNGSDASSSSVRARARAPLLQARGYLGEDAEIHSGTASPHAPKRGSDKNSAVTDLQRHQYFSPPIVARATQAQAQASSPPPPPPPPPMSPPAPAADAEDGTRHERHYQQQLASLADDQRKFQDYVDQRVADALQGAYALGVASKAKKEKREKGSSKKPTVPPPPPGTPPSLSAERDDVNQSQSEAPPPPVYTHDEGCQTPEGHGINPPTASDNKRGTTRSSRMTSPKSGRRGGNRHGSPRSPKKASDPLQLRKQRENAAAMKIQCGARQRQALLKRQKLEQIREFERSQQEEVNKKLQHATVIQCAERQRQARQALDAKKAGKLQRNQAHEQYLQEQEEQMNRVAMKIQCAERQRQARKQRRALEDQKKRVQQQQEQQRQEQAVKIQCAMRQRIARTERNALKKNAEAEEARLKAQQSLTAEWAASRDVLSDAVTDCHQQLLEHTRVFQIDFCNNLRHVASERDAVDAQRKATERQLVHEQSTNSVKMAEINKALGALKDAGRLIMVRGRKMALEARQEQADKIRQGADHLQRAADALRYERQRADSYEHELLKQAKARARQPKAEPEGETESPPIPSVEANNTRAKTVMVKSYVEEDESSRSKSGKLQPIRSLPIPSASASDSSETTPMIKHHLSKPQFSATASTMVPTHVGEAKPEAKPESFPLHTPPKRPRGPRKPSTVLVSLSDSGVQTPTTQQLSKSQSRNATPVIPSLASKASLAATNHAIEVIVTEGDNNVSSAAAQTPEPSDIQAVDNETTIEKKEKEKTVDAEESNGDNAAEKPKTAASVEGGGPKRFQALKLLCELVPDTSNESTPTTATQNPPLSLPQSVNISNTQEGAPDADAEGVSTHTSSVNVSHNGGSSRGGASPLEMTDTAVGIARDTTVTNSSHNGDSTRDDAGDNDGNNKADKPAPTRMLKVLKECVPPSPSTSHDGQPPAAAIHFDNVNEPKEQEEEEEGEVIERTHSTTTVEEPEPVVAAAAAAEPEGALPEGAGSSFEAVMQQEAEDRMRRKRDSWERQKDQVINEIKASISLARSRSQSQSQSQVVVEKKVEEVKEEDAPPVKSDEAAASPAAPAAPAPSPAGVASPAAAAETESTPLLSSSSPSVPAAPASSPSGPVAEPVDATGTPASSGTPALAGSGSTPSMMSPGSEVKLSDARVEEAARLVDEACHAAVVEDAAKMRSRAASEADVSPSVASSPQQQPQQQQQPAKEAQEEEEVEEKEEKGKEEEEAETTPGTMTLHVHGSKDVPPPIGIPSETSASQSSMFSPPNGKQKQEVEEETETSQTKPTEQTATEQASTSQEEVPFSPPTQAPGSSNSAAADNDHSRNDNDNNNNAEEVEPSSNNQQPQKVEQQQQEAAGTSLEEAPIPVSELHIQVDNKGFISGKFAPGAVVAVGAASANEASASASKSQSFSSTPGAAQALAFGVLNASDCLPSAENVVMFVHQGCSITIEDQKREEEKGEGVAEEEEKEKPAFFAPCLPNGDPRAATQAWEVVYDSDFRYVWLRSVARYDCWLALRPRPSSSVNNNGNSRDDDADEGEGGNNNSILVLSSEAKRSKFQLFAIE